MLFGRGLRVAMRLRLVSHSDLELRCKAAMIIK